MSKYTDRIDTRFPYTTAAETDKPGYLAERFDDIRKAQAKEKAEEAAAKVEAESVEQEVQRKVRRIAK
ncbi:MAG: hypothetical protein NUV63_12230 [Gallionella sp.]|nr:hypothetical protein [Gallionella sp.]